MDTDRKSLNRADWVGMGGKDLDGAIRRKSIIPECKKHASLVSSAHANTLHKHESIVIYASAYPTEAESCFSRRVHVSGHASNDIGKKSSGFSLICGCVRSFVVSLKGGGKKIKSRWDCRQTYQKPAGRARVLRRYPVTTLHTMRRHVQSFRKDARPSFMSPCCVLNERNAMTRT